MMTRPIPVVTEHRCARRHISATGFLRCVYPGTVTIVGYGRYAVITCKPRGISLWPSLDQAVDAGAQLDQRGCGRHCDHRHEVVEIDQSDLR